MKKTFSLAAASLLRNYFEEAETSTYANRKFGLEIETLVVHEITKEIISRDTSQNILLSLIEDFKWELKGKFRETYGEIKKDGFILKYDVGWNLFELVTPVELVSRCEVLFDRTMIRLQEFYRAADKLEAAPLFTYTDGDESHALIESTEMDALYLELNSAAINYLGHIAAIHYNIDLTSIEEGIRAIQIINSYYKEKNYPLPESLYYWNKFMTLSRANYESERFGAPPEDFEDYIKKLASLRVYMNSNGGGLYLQKPPQMIDENMNVDLDVFVTYVWWWTRFRVRNNKLVLEIRNIPRQTDSDIASAFGVLCDRLDFKDQESNSRN
ncbi:MAG: hypothetical protein H0U45_01655 [Tatlockia sp.]|jgi:hypothetical protein|nr:hypothetical protein [Tatlockia sp.]